MNTLFRECVEQVPAEVKIFVDLSFSVADRIDAALKERGMTQKQLAQAMGKTENEVSRWMGGTHNFTLKTIAKISSILNVDLLR